VLMKKLDADTLHALKTRLAKLPTRQNFRAYDVVVELAETMSAARARGYEIDDLVMMLAEAGIKLSRNTVRNYLSQARRNRPVIGRTTTHSSPSTVTTPSCEPGGRERVGAISTAAKPSPRETPSVLERARELRASKQPDESHKHEPGRFALVPDTDL
jgi:hypothetical protein